MSELMRKMAPECMAGRLRLCFRPLLFDLCLIFLILLICSPSGNALITYDWQTLLNLRSFHHYGPGPCWNIGDTTSPWMDFSTSTHVLPLPFPYKKRIRKWGKQRGIRVCFKAYLKARAVANLHATMDILQHPPASQDRFSVRSVTHRWIRPVRQQVNSAFPVACLPIRTWIRAFQGGVHCSNLSRLSRAPSKNTAPLTQVALLNVRSLVNKTFVLNDFFLTPGLDALFLTETWIRPGKRGTGGGKLSYQRALLLRTKKPEDRQCVSASVHKEEDDDDEEEEEIREGRRKDKRPVASTPVPGSPWCVVWTGDDRVFFFNPTIHLSVWERPGELIDRDISHIIEDPPHKRKKTLPSEISSSCQSTGLHRNDEDEDDDLKHSNKRNRTEESMSLVPHPGGVQLLPLELRIAHFKEMMLERGVSAFSTWEKELHKMVFDPRYLLLTSDQRKQVFDQFVKSRMKDEYKEKRSKLQKAREEFKQLLEEAKITSRTTFKEFCVRYRDDQRFSILTRKKEQEVLFSHYITALKKREKENRTRLRKMR